MAGADFSASQVGWFIVAGFILGFATSTLWEWLYYRQKRRAQVEAALLAVLPIPRADSLPEQADNSIDETADLQSAESWGARYRGSGIYLESEQPTIGQAELTPDDTFAEIDNEIAEAEAADTSNHLAAPRINPATLAALQAAVAESPIAHSTTLPKSYHMPQARHTASPSAPEFADPNDMLASERAADEINVREITTYTDPSTTSSSADKQSVEQSVDAGHTDVKAAESQSAPPVTSMNRTHRAADYPDDLALIKGVGEAYKRRLYGAGIYTWRQVAESDIESLRRITRAKPNANIEDWHVQAQTLAEKYQRWHTNFRGPLDDFMQIDGIGAITADTLYKAGFCTYEQLAAALPDELAKIVPAPTVGNENDFDGWINRAVQLANAKLHNSGARA